MKKSFILGVFGILFLLFASFHVYMNKMAKSDFRGFLTRNSLSFNVNYGEFKRKLLGNIIVKDINIKGVPNKDFSYEIEEVSFNQDMDKVEFDVKGLKINIGDYLKSKNIGKEELWDISRKFDVEKDIIKNTIFSLASIGFDELLMDVKANFNHNKETDETYLKLSLSIKDFGNIVLIGSFNGIGKDFFEITTDFMKSFDFSKVKDEAIMKSFYISYVDKSFVKKVYKNITTYSYEDVEAEDFDKIGFLKINELSKRFKDIGFDDKNSEEFAKNIALFYNQNNKMVVVSNVNEGVSFEKIREVHNVFELLYLIKSEIYVSDEAKSKFISLN
ncbi:MAG: hypothetical protein BWY78_00619 [Alphaproteobacteria bacterium ADurb.Bin438]|nr:MAG: hypothetical protein BWY78_00619 [Alphaproteobacteria bacterium ADurb.Bin438]